MKLYLAGGMTVANVTGRERELSDKFPSWKRLFSFFYMNLIDKSQILIIKKEQDEQNK